MITKVSDFLRELQIQESLEIKRRGMKHGPTIGSMYEGLTEDVLSRAIPANWDLKITKGFITDSKGNLSGQIDCMLVHGEGKKLPYIDNYVWHVLDVIAIFEVKKNLYSKDLIDSYGHLLRVLELYGQEIENPSKKTSEYSFEIERVNKSFHLITGIIAPEFQDIGKLGFEYEQIYHSILLEYIAPIRIVFGYEGFKTESSFRLGFNKLVDENIGKRGFGPVSFPQQIIAGDFSLVKANGFPYAATMNGDSWPFFNSTRDNPILILLELIWTRLGRFYNISDLWGDDLNMECFSPFLSALPIRRDEQVGWLYRYTELSEEELSEPHGQIEWEPCFLETPHATILTQLSNGLEVNIDEPDFKEWLRNYGHDPDEFIKSFIETRLVGLDGINLEIIAEELMFTFLPDGRIAAADNSTGRFTNWLSKNVFK